jgi:hypothetical protein
MKGFNLLLLFATGPLEDGVCGKRPFAKKVKEYLEGDVSLEIEIREQIPKQLKTAWPILTAIARRSGGTPLSFETVSTYVFEKHNPIVSSECRVKGGIVRNIGNNNLKIETPKGTFKIRFFDHYEKDVKLGDYVAFHHGWFVSKITFAQYRRLNRG